MELVYLLVFLTLVYSYIYKVRPGIKSRGEKKQFIIEWEND